MNRKTVVLPVLAGLLAPLLAACGDGSGSGGDDTVVVGTTDEFAVSKDNPAPFDPAASYDIAGWNIMRSTFQTLVRIPRSGTEPEADAAEKCGFTDSHNEQYRCTLKDGQHFSNGNQLDAEDVEFSMRRQLSINYVNGPASLFSNVDKVEAVDEKQVVFHLKKPDATFPLKLTTPAAAIVDSETYPKDGFVDGFSVTGSGPYVVDSFEPSEGKAVLSRNPDYDGGLNVRNKGIELRFFKSAKSMEQALTAGDIDVMNRTISPSQVDRLGTAKDEGVQLVEQPGQEIRYLVFDTDDRTAGRKAVRRAVAQVVDRQKLVRDAYSRTSEPLYSPVPSGLPGHNNAFFNEYGRPSPAAARATLEKAGIDTPVKLQLAYTTDHYGEATAEEFKILKKQLNDTGLFEVTTTGTKWKNFQPAALKGKYQVFGYGWFPDFPDADNYLAPFMEENNHLNSSYINREIRDKLIPQSRRQTERANASQQFGRAQDLVAEDVPILPLWQGKQYVAARDDITGVEWALNASSLNQFWELGRGVSD
ncbi:ABC transporter substrate-binding protein [Streptomyces xiaopingdaonensis]|uniref:ABC transporter substrate-binding protein n=1 Tax=Streptomyces xiaopingdaonensis TaxID=1565415 RepID=UPI00031F5EC1|nr:ABC transporter substrate-binding protein [Streptomyces xiaopingdaonensis]